MKILYNSFEIYANYGGGGRGRSSFSRRQSGGASRRINILGIELDTNKMELILPQDKLLVIKNTLLIFLESKTIQIQSLVGLLHFACKDIVPGRFLVDDSLTRLIM